MGIFCNTDAGDATPYGGVSQAHSGQVLANRISVFFPPIVLLVVLFCGVPEGWAQAVSIDQTTADQRQLLQAQPEITFSRASRMTGDRLRIVVKDVDRQEFDGVGAALTDSGAWLIANKLTAAQRQKLLAAFFGRDGAGLGIVTTGMSGSGYDMNGYPSFTYDDLPSGTDFPQAKFSVVHDDTSIVPLLHQIQSVNPAIKLFGIPYSAPAWMKDSGKLDTGTFIARPEYEKSFATYFVRYVQAYRDRNLPLYALMIENEPDYVSGTYPSMLLSAPEEARIITYLGPALRAAGFATVKILGWDHNWSVPPGTQDSGNGRKVENVSRKDDGLEYPEELLRSSAERFLAGTAYHCYAGEPAVQATLHRAFPHKGIWDTECAGGPLSTSWQEAFSANMSRLIIPEIRNWSRSHVWWTLTQDQEFGPQYGNCSSKDCSPLVMIDTRTSPVTVHYLPGYYMLAHIGRFVLPGAHVVESDDSGIPEVAFRNPDGSHVLVVCNPQPGPAAIRVEWNHSSFTYDISSNAIVTFTWNKKLAAGRNISVPPHGL